jgi:hypothetical protein
MNQLSMFCFALFAILLCVINGLKNNRHACIFKNYDSVRGPYFNALFDQVIEQSGFETKRGLLVRIDDDNDNLIENLVSDLDFDDMTVIRLDKISPRDLMHTIDAFSPTVIWGADAKSALQLRYFMRTSGLDFLVETLCGSMNQRSLLYVGEGSSAMCCGSDMKVARNHDRAPEPQFRGLELLGSDLSISFDQLLPELEENKTLKLLESQVYVWSQCDGKATSFFMRPDRRGAIEQFRTPDPLPPLVEEDYGGRRCIGEPSVDPSRMLHMRGDSEWFEGEM